MRSTRRHRLLLAPALAVTALLLTSCSDADHETAEHQTATAPGAATAGAASTADVEFAQAMIPHHEGAITMAEAALAVPDSSLHGLAEQVIAAQRPEIAQLEAWLEEWDADAGHGGHTEPGHGPEGMPLPDDATGAAFDAAWLEGMIEHHRGAIAMAQEQLEDGTHPGARAMAEEIIAAQEAEIADMQRRLGELTGAAPEEDEQQAADAVAILEPASPAQLPEAHVHGVGIDPADGAVLLAAHDGLHRYGADGPVRVGPEIDLMGFAVVGPDHFVGSGHPGPGVDLPNPVGLIESRDGGQTWTSLSRAGESDFHALSAAAGTVAGFDGTVQVSPDGTTWEPAGLDEPVAALAVGPDGSTMLATTQSGLQRSADGGVTWSLVEGAPLMVLVAAAGDRTWVGLTTEGVVAVSEDGADTWQERASVGTTVQAFTAAPGPDGVQVVVVDDRAVQVSDDGGRTFNPLGGS